ncbi:MAG: hypothetical protein HeimC2_21600 [Candidatus Heimdallarchaeota archaeon LC_2]|nr:MAG: hypothetical protein HeimC2_21600 [Candidatus Heimdallarchaeota archaeon LC_2]
MVPQSDYNESSGVKRSYPIISLEYTDSGILRKKLYSEDSLSIQFVRIAAITFPRTLEIYDEKQLPKMTAKTIRKLRYNTSPMIDEEATYRSLRDKYLLHNQSTIDVKAIREKYISSYLSQLIKNNVDIHIINSPEENVLLIVGVEYSTKILIHPRSYVRSQIVTTLVDQHYMLDQYPNLIGMSSLAKINKNFQISFFQSTQQHLQMQKIDRRIIYRLIDRISNTSILSDEYNENYKIEGFTKSKLEKSSSLHCFQLYLDNDEVMNYGQVRGTSLVIHADQDKFQSWLLKYSFYVKSIKTPQITEINNSIVVIGGPKPLGYSEIDSSTLRLDLLEIIKNNPYDVWMPVFRLIGALYTYSPRQNIAAEFNQYWSDIKEEMGELMSQVDSFDKLLEKLADSFENEIILTDDVIARSLLSVFNQIKLVKTLDYSDEDFKLPRRSYISIENYTSRDALLLLFTLSLKADVDLVPIHSIVINDYDLSSLMTMDKVRMILDDKNTGFDDVCKVHRATRMRQSRFNTMPKIILSYNHEVRKFLTKNKFTKYEDGKKRIPLFEKSCLLLPDQPLRRIFVSNPDEDMINSVAQYEKSAAQIQNIDVHIDEVSEVPLDNTIKEDIKDDDPINDSEAEDFEEEIIDEEIVEEIKDDDPITDFAEEDIEEEILDEDEVVDKEEEPNQSETEVEVSEETTNNVEDQTTPEDNEHSMDNKSIPIRSIPIPGIKPKEIINKEQHSDDNKAEIPVPSNIDKALRQYNEIFDNQKIYDRVLQNEPVLTQDSIFTQIDSLVANLSNLYQFYITKDMKLSKEMVKEKELEKLRDNELITIHPSGDIFMIELTKEGKKYVNEMLGRLNSLCSDLKQRGIDIQNIMINSSTIMEQYRQQGKIKYEVALLNWPKLLSLAYYEKFSKIAPDAHGIYLKITKIIKDGSWISNHDEFIKSFVKRYQNKLYSIEQEILTKKDQILEKADMKTLPKIKIIPPSDPSTIDSSDQKKIADLELSDDDGVKKLDTTLNEYDQFIGDDPEPENFTDKEIIKIQTYEKEDEKKPEIKPRRTKAAKDRVARELLKKQRTAFLVEKENNDFKNEFFEANSEENKSVIVKRMKERIENVKIKSPKTLYFFQPSWNMSIDESKHQFDLEELPISLFNFKTKTKKLLVGVLETAKIGELMRTNIDWSKLPTIGKKTHDEIVDFQLLFNNWSELKGEEIFNLMCRDGLKHLFEEKIFFEPSKLPDNILLPLHVNLMKRYRSRIDGIIETHVGRIDDVEISRKIISEICNDLGTVMGIEIENEQAEVLIHKLNQYQHSNYKMSNAESDPFFDLTWIMKFDNYSDNPDKSMRLDELKSKITQDLDHLMLSYQVQKEIMSLHRLQKNSQVKDKSNNKKRKEQLA